MVNENTGQVLAYGTVEQHSGHRRVDAAAQAQHYLVVAKLLFEFGHSRVDKRFGAPALSGATDACHKVFEQLHAALRVVYFGVELYAPYFFAFYLVGRAGHFGGRGYDVEVGRKLGDGVAVAHPHLCAGFDAAQQRVHLVDLGEIGTAILARVGRLHFATVGIGHKLCAVADSQQRIVTADTVELNPEGFLVVDRERAAG